MCVANIELVLGQYKEIIRVETLELDLKDAVERCNHLYKDGFVSCVWKVCDI